MKNISKKKQFKKQNNTVLLTAEGLEKIKNEYNELVNNKLPYAINRVSIARELGDLAENSEYSAARQELEMIESQIAEYRKIIDNSQVVQDTGNNSIVSLGSTVVVESEGGINEFTIVGSLESNPMKGKISNESLVGKALLGAKVGQTIVISSSIKTTYKIKEIK